MCDCELRQRLCIYAMPQTRRMDFICLQIRVGLIFEGLYATTLGIHCLPNNERWRMSTDPHSRGKPLASVCQWASL